MLDLSKYRTMLKVVSANQRERVAALLGDSSATLVDMSEYGITLDGFVTFDELSSVVDYVRGVVHSSNKDLCLGTGIETREIDLRDTPVSAAETWIRSLGALGYDVESLLATYRRDKVIVL